MKLIQNRYTPRKPRPRQVPAWAARTLVILLAVLGVAWVLVMSCHRM